MNVENIRRVIAALEASEGYDQTKEFQYQRIDAWCGSPACVLGHAEVCRVLAMGGNLLLDNAGCPFLDSTRRVLLIHWLGLDERQYDLIYSAFPMCVGSPTKQDAIAMLENLIETGRVEWRSA